MIPIIHQLIRLLILAMPIACISWTLTHEEIFFEPREYCRKQCTESSNLLKRKFYYVFTCEYCLSHYVTILLLIITGYKLLFEDWRGYLISGFSLVWIANAYMNFYGLIRMDIKKEKTETMLAEKKLDEK